MFLIFLCKRSADGSGWATVGVEGVSQKYKEDLRRAAVNATRIKFDHLQPVIWCDPLHDQGLYRSPLLSY